MVVKTFPVAFMVYAVLGIAHGASWGIVAPVNQRLYDALTYAVGGEGTAAAVYMGAVGVMLVMLGQQVLNGVHNFFSQYLHGRARGHLHGVVHQKLARLPAQLFEDKDKLDDIEKSNNGIDGGYWLLCTLSDGLFFYGAYYSVMVVYLWRMKPMLVVAFIFIFAPVALSQIIRAKLYAKLEEESAPVRRQNGHYGGCLVSGTSMRETRLFGAYNFFKKLFMDTLMLLAQKEWNVAKKVAAMDLGLNAIKTAGWLGTTALLFDALMKQDISVGAFAAVFTSINMMFGMLEEIFNRIKWSVTDELGKIHNFINLLEYAEHEATAPQTPPQAVDFAKGIEARGLSFTYPKAEKPAIDGVSLTIRPGETVALVGENGSGKTTLVKLLCGLFKPGEGRATIGGLDSAHAQNQALFAKTSAVFQDYAAYAFSLRDNVLISDFSREKTREKGDASEESDESVAASLAAADVDVHDTATFPGGLDTILSREYDGVELSGGQWQRVAMARGLFRRHDFIVLDEPTAAIDPIEESNVYRRFAQSSRDKTALLVTHRLGSARIADRILVMDGGKIVEEGTHDALCRANGKYAQMWAAQAAAYQEG
jgi:ATP-binding cassette subfamily B protein